MKLTSNTVRVTVFPSGPPTGALKVSISQAGRSPSWRISGLTPGGQFNVTGQASFTGAYGNQYWGDYDQWSYTAASTGEDSREFSRSSLPASGTEIRLIVTDLTTGDSVISPSFTLS